MDTTTYLDTIASANPDALIGSLERLMANRKISASRATAVYVRVRGRHRVIEARAAVVKAVEDLTLYYVHAAEKTPLPADPGAGEAVHQAFVATLDNLIETCRRAT